jgi:hypothetical protein
VPQLEFDHRAGGLCLLLSVLLEREKEGLSGKHTGFWRGRRPVDVLPQLALRQPNNLPRAEDLWFRYDPPVLIVAVTWYQTVSKFGKLVHDLLSFSYAGNEESVRAPRLERCGLALMPL